MKFLLIVLIVRLLTSRRMSKANKSKGYWVEPEKKNCLHPAEFGLRWMDERE